MTPAAREQRNRAERIEMLAGQARSGSLAAWVATAVLGLMIVPAAGWGPYGLWALCMIASYSVRDHVVGRMVRRGDPTEQEVTLVAMSSVPLAGVIAFPGVAFMPLMSPDVRGLYTAVQVGWVAVAALVIGIHARSYRLYVLISFSLLALGWWRIVPVPLAVVATIMLSVGGFVLTRFAQRLTRVFNDSIEMRHANEDLVAKLTASLAETAQAHQARSRFLAAASHDLLQPVHALMLLVGVLRDSTSAAAREQAARRIELTTNAIASMFRGLLDQARLDAGAVTSKPEQVALAAVCRGIEAAYAAQCLDKGVKFSVDCPPDLLVLADAALLDRVLRNLVDNAVKFTARGSVSLIAERRAREVLVQVVDTGVGIEAEDQPRVFDAFFRGAGADRAGIEGVGLGLAVTAQMIGLMGCRIHLESTPGTGTRVQVSLPAAAPIRQMPPPPPARSSTLGFSRILVIEDDRNAREALQLWLADHGSETVCAASLGEALALCDERSFVPDYVLSDLHLADGPDGIRTIEAVRARFGAVPASLITGEAIDADQVPTGVGLLRKPAQPAHLEKLLQARRAEAEAAT